MTPQRRVQHRADCGCSICDPTLNDRRAEAWRRMGARAPQHPAGCACYVCWPERPCFAEGLARALTQGYAPSWSEVNRAACALLHRDAENLRSKFAWGRALARSGHRSGHKVGGGVP